MGDDLSNADLFRIGEVAELVGVESHVLRYWEAEFGLQPERSSSGQRLYRRTEIAKFLEIRRLLHGEGFTIAGARKALLEGASKTAHQDEDLVRRARSRVRTVREKLALLREKLSQGIIRGP